MLRSPWRESTGIFKIRSFVDSYSYTFKEHGVMKGAATNNRSRMTHGSLFTFAISFIIFDNIEIFSDSSGNSLHSTSHE